MKQDQDGGTVANVEVCSPSYPKTGNTWVRVLIGRYLQQLYRLPYLPLLEGTEEERDAISRHIAFHHGPLTWENQTADDLDDENVCAPYLGGKVILIVRHPLDSLLSLFMQAQNRGGFDTATLPTDFDMFLRSDVFGLKKFIKFHNLWAGHLPNPDIHLVRYEDLRGDASRFVVKLLTFLDLPIHESLIADAISFASFDNMQKLERNSPLTYRSSGFNIFATGDRANPNAFHVRSGKVGGYKEYLSAEQIAEHKQTVQALNPVYGYSA